MLRVGFPVLGLLTLMSCAQNAVPSPSFSDTAQEAPPVPPGDYCAPNPCGQPEPIQPLNPPARSPTRRPGTVSNAARVVAALRPAFKACYNAGLGRDPRMAGRILLTFVPKSPEEIQTPRQRIRVVPSPH
jgi:hypothetical protein